MLLLFGLSSALAAATLACGQVCTQVAPDKIYHPRPIFRLGPLDGCETGEPPQEFMQDAWYASTLAGSDQLGVLAMNVHGEVVGTYIATLEDGCIPRPFVWLPNDAYGLLAGVYDLLTLTGSGAAEIGYAWDITDSGLVVGGRGGIADTDGSLCRATSWNLQSLPQSTTFQATDLDTSPLTPFLWSMALAAEPFADPLELLDIVGVGGQRCSDFRMNAAFNPATMSGSVISILQPAGSMYYPFVNGLRNWACDIANLTSPVGAFDWPSVDALGSFPGTPPCQAVGGNPMSCEMPFQCGVAFPWVPIPKNRPFRQFRRNVFVTPSTLIPDQITGVRSISHWQSSVLEDNVVAGLVKLLDDTCPRLPALWEYAIPGVSHELPLPSGITQATAQRWREMPNGCGTDVVVGWNADGTELPNGVVWSRCMSGGPWDFCVWTADGLQFTTPPLRGAGYNVMQVYEVKDTGEMLVIVRDTVSAPSAQGYYLAELGLVCDGDGDLLVGAADLSFVLAAWGSTSSMGQDFDHDGIIGASDLAVLLGQWGTTGLRLACGGDFCISEELPGIDDAPESLRTALEAFGVDCASHFCAAARDMDGALLHCTCETMHAIINAVEESQ